jgi:hypothetical protein
MSVDTRISLPSEARIRDVADVMGVLAGLKPELLPLSKDSIHVEVPGVRIQGFNDSSLTGCADIILEGQVVGEALIDGRIRVTAMYFFEWEHGEEYASGLRRRTGLGKGIIVRSTSFWISIANGLVDFFGGEVDYQDCDDAYIDYSAPYQPIITAFDGEEWNKLQRKIASVKPLKQADLEYNDRYAAYKVVEHIK